MTDEYFMREAIAEAKKAYELGEVSVGAVIVRKGEIIGRGFNRVESTSNPTAHAEILAITEASRAIGDWRLDECTLYVTSEPCQMCMGAAFFSRINRVVYGAKQPRTGACGSFADTYLRNPFNREIEVKGGVCEEECITLLRSFFGELRAERLDESKVPSGS